MGSKDIAILFIGFIVLSSFYNKKTDRKKVVQRHNVTLHSNNPAKPMQVSNGEFAFSVDITGMQTFDTHNTMAQWGFDSRPLPTRINPNNFKGKVYNINGQPVEFEMDPAEQSEIVKWLAANPHPVNLCKIGLHITQRNGSLAKISDIKNTRQHLNLWTGIMPSSFVFDNTLVVIKTACHPKLDEIGIEINSALVARGQLKIAVEFPYADDKEFSEFVEDYSSFQKHTTTTQKNNQQLFVQRQMDDLKYFLMITANNGLRYKYADSTKNPHKLFIIPTAKLNKPETAIDMLLFQKKHNSDDCFGYNSWIYFPANGGSLSAIAMMAGGWEGGTAGYAPGFPKNGKWNVNVEGFRKML